MKTTDFTKNNLDKANSPYLRQHQNNPIHWQEWHKEVLTYAQKGDKPIFVSVGYATCHWCHVMAKEAFADSSVADYLNKHFVSIKVDREQRPDIDQHFMNFLTKTQGGGGWPMNVILTPGQKPFFAGTYFPPVSAYGRPGFKQVLGKVYDWYQKNYQNIKSYVPTNNYGTEEQSEQVLLEKIKDGFDSEYGGWGDNVKFPSYNTLIFLLNYFQEHPSKDTKNMITQTLDRMAKGGLYDHLQGGFFRYCVDRQWRIPHFEKMLYDQAMLLWVYSLGYKIFGESLYKEVVKGIVTSLDNVFASNDLYYSATDADTNHKEGETYLWSQDELKEILSETEWQDFKDVYDLSEGNKLERKLHLVKKTNKFLPDIERKLLAIRNKRAQPDKDRKIITSWNALLGIAFLIAGRYFKNDSYKKRGLNLYQRLITAHWNDKTLAHSSFEDHLQKTPFLEDYASTLLLSTYVYEEDFTNLETAKKLRSKLMDYFKEGKWMENVEAEDFKPITASFADHPTPSSISLAEEALRRSSLILGEVDERNLKYKTPLSSDFYNSVVFYKLGNFHVIHSQERLDYSSLPVNSIQLKGHEYQDCYKMECQRFENQKSLLDELNKRSFFAIE